MPPKKALTCSQIVRLSQVALADTCQTWEVKCSAHALDLEIRAALARRMVGGDGICTGPCAASHGSPVKQVVPVEKEPENPFEEYAEPLGCDIVYDFKIFQARSFLVCFLAPVACESITSFFQFCC